MKTRTASLQVAHQKSCPAFGRAGLDSLDGCRCKPSYFTFYRDSAGRIVRGDDGTGEIVGRTRRRRDAERWLARLQDRIEEGTGDPNRQQSVAFAAWVETYKAILAKRVERGKLKARTLRDYGDTLARAVEEIGHADLRTIRERDIERFADSYGEEASEATLGRALRELSACLASAIDHDPPYLERNPRAPVRQEARARHQGARQGPVHRRRAAEAVGRPRGA